MLRVSLNQLRHYQLGRQGLLERQTPPDLSPFGVLHATDHTTPYLSLWARVANFQWQALADELAQGRFQRWRAMRGTLHLIPDALQSVVTCLYRVAEEDPVPEFDEYGITLDEARELRFYILESLQINGAQSPTSIKKLLAEHLIRQHINHQGHQISNIAPVMRWLWSLGILETGRHIHHWRSKDDRYSISTRLDLDCHDKAQARVDLARAYFEAYAPAAYEDWVWWSGFKTGIARATFKTLEGELSPVTVVGIDEPLWIMTSQAEALAQMPDEPPQMVRFLPYEDALIKAYKTTRHRFYDADGLAEEVAFSKYGEALPTIWLNGQIIGVWEWGRKLGDPITIEPFLQMTKALRKSLKLESDPLAGFLETKHILWAD